VVAISEDGEVRVAGRVPSPPEGLTLLAQSLVPSDRVALEVTGSCWEVARSLGPRVDRVVVISPDHTGFTQARAKTDWLDARTLAQLLWAGELESVWRRSRTEELTAAVQTARDGLVLRCKLDSCLVGVDGRAPGRMSAWR